jgi:pantoate--beta-alanine ligase
VSDARAGRDGSRAFVALGSNLGDRSARLLAGLRALAATPGVRLAAVSPAYENPAVGGPPQPDYLNAVAELVTTLSPEALLERLHAIEAAEGRVRGVPDAPRTLDLDLLVHGDLVRPRGRPTLPHPDAATRAFVLRPWRDVAPHVVGPGLSATVLELDARLRAADPASHTALRPRGMLAPSRAEGSTGGDAMDRSRRPLRLEDRAALAAFRDRARGLVGFVPTLGALHEGHASHARRARAECDVVVASVFVNPLQFGPDEDYARYPRTVEADLDLLGREGVDAVFVPSREELYPDGFATSVDVAGPSAGFEGAARPGHFRGVATVVTLLTLAVRPDRSYYGQKDAQQVAVLRRVFRDLGLPGTIVVGPTVRDLDGLALSSRNRYLSPAERATALAIPRALAAASDAAARGVRDADGLVAAARAVLDPTPGLAPDYVAVVDPDSFEPVAHVAPGAPALMVVAARVGRTRLLDNEWMAVQSPRTGVRDAASEAAPAAPRPRTVRA